MSAQVHAGEADRWGGWQWREPARGEHFRRCSYCGSMHPQDLVTIARGRVDWADRKYGWPHKFYVHVPNQNPDALFCTSATPRVEPRPTEAPGGLTVEQAYGRPYVRREDLTEEQIGIIVRDGMARDRDDLHYEGYQFGTRREHFGKVYTVHLADPALSDDVREQAAQLCGLRFAFMDDGRIRWEPAS